MNKIFMFVVGLLLAGSTFATQGPPVYINTGATPSGTCTGVRSYIQETTGLVYCCNAGTWAACGTAALGSVNTIQQSNGSGGLQAYTGTGTCAANNWMTALSATGVQTCSQPGFSNLSGTIAMSQLTDDASTGKVLISGGAGDPSWSASPLVSGLTASTAINTPLVQAGGAVSLNLTGNVADGLTAIGVKIGNQNTLVNPAAKIVSFYQDGGTTEKAYIMSNGEVHFSGEGYFSGLIAPKLYLGTLSGSAPSILPSSGQLQLTSAVADGATAVAFNLGNSSAMTIAGGKILSLNNGAGEKFYVSSAGFSYASAGMQVGVGTNTLPTCDATSVGRIVHKRPTTGPDEMHACLRNGDGTTYGWTMIAIAPQ